MITFIKGLVRDVKNTGAILPSSPYFAREMTRAVRQSRSAARILEIGPGSGPMTRQIVRALRPGDQFDVVEINPVFAAKVDSEILAPAREHLASVRITLHADSILTVPLSTTYNIIISSLPLNNFEPDLVRRILDRLLALLRPDGELHFFEYAYIRKLRLLVGATGPNGRLRKVDAILEEFLRDHGTSRRFVFLNIPPAMKHSVVLAPRRLAAG